MSTALGVRKEKKKIETPGRLGVGTLGFSIGASQAVIGKQSKRDAVKRKLRSSRNIELQTVLRDTSGAEKAKKTIGQVEAHSRVPEIPKQVTFIVQVQQRAPSTGQAREHGMGLSLCISPPPQQE